MKRGLIAWDKSEIPPNVFARRLQEVRQVLEEAQLPAAVVYSDLWRSNHARFLSNYMPYFNRALLVIPFDQPTILLCGLSPRVYGWIRSVTIIEDVRPAKNLAQSLGELASERGWTKLGIFDKEGLPYDVHQAIHRGPVDLVNLEPPRFVDDTDLSMRRKALAMARAILEDEMQRGVGSLDYQLVGRLEGRLRKAGAEDLVILVTNGATPPAPAKGEALHEGFSVSLALEYRGHWIRLSRYHAPPERMGLCRSAFEDPVLPCLVYENLGRSYPFEYIDKSAIKPGVVFAVHSEVEIDEKRLFHGDTYWFSSEPELL